MSGKVTRGLRRWAAKVLNVRLYPEVVGRSRGKKKSLRSE